MNPQKKPDARPRGQIPAHWSPPRSFTAYKWMHDLAFAAGVSVTLFTKYDFHPYKSHKHRVKAVARELRQMIDAAPYIEYGAMGYPVCRLLLDKDGEPRRGRSGSLIWVEDPAALERAKQAELLAFQGRWLLEEEEQELRDMEMAPVLSPLLATIFARVPARQRAEAVYGMVEAEHCRFVMRTGRLVVDGELPDHLGELVNRLEPELQAIHDERES